MSFTRFIIPAVFLISSLGCRSTVSFDELQAELNRTQGNTYPGELVLERSTVEYLYYRIETDLGTHGRYRVPRNDIMPIEDE